MRLATDHATLTVPATSANLGPGFDTLGLALDLRDRVIVRAVAGETRVTVLKTPFLYYKKFLTLLKITLLLPA